ncbi:MAG: DUF4249 family protein [Balneolaceae bacterium]
MNKTNIRNALLIILYITAGACELHYTSNESEYAVVDTYLVTDRFLPQIRFSRTAALFGEFGFDEQGLQDAEIKVSLLAHDGETVEITIHYEENRPGVYYPSETLTVLPEREYLLEAEHSDFGPIRATTKTPARVQYLSPPPDSISYQSSDQVDMIVSSKLKPGGLQNVYIFTTISQDPFYEALTPLYRDLFDNSETGLTLESLAKNPSGLINEASFERLPDGNIRLRYPWLGLAFYGNNLIVVNSLDRNTYDFIRSQQVQLGGSTLSPGEIPNAIYHIDGAIGIFGSLSSDTLHTYVTR